MKSTIGSQLQIYSIISIRSRSGTRDIIEKVESLQKVKECKNQVRKGAFYDRLCEVENDIVKMDSFDPDQKG